MNLEEEFRICPNCNYQRGFHVFFKNVKGKTIIGLISPNCGQSYNLGWLPASIKSVKPEKDPTY